MDNNIKMDIWNVVCEEVDGTKLILGQCPMVDFGIISAEYSHFPPMMSPPYRGGGV
jgi:hypothetical protein